MMCEQQRWVTPVMLMCTLAHRDIRTRFAKMCLVGIVLIKLMIRKCKGKRAFIEIIIMTDEPENKSWASRQFHLELFPTALNSSVENPNPTIESCLHSTYMYIQAKIEEIHMNDAFRSNYTAVPTCHCKLQIYSRELLKCTRSVGCIIPAIASTATSLPFRAQPALASFSASYGQAAH